MNRSCADPCTIVVFGATGDLAARKLLPALFRLRAQNLLAKDTVLVGFGRSERTREQFQQHLHDIWRELERRSSTGCTDTCWREVVERVYYQQGNYDDVDSFESLAELIREVEGQFNTGGRRVFYLATPPTVFGNIVELLGNCGLVDRRPEGGAWSRVVVEKPFGHDLESARQMNSRINAVLDESQIFRIDHYLGKETVQNLLVFRFANAIFEPIWNAQHIDHIQITAAESLGVEARGGYYDGIGAVRDMIQNHVLQLLSLVAMEPPGSLAPDAVHDEKVKLLRAIRPFTPERVVQDAVAGQYVEGQVDNQEVAAYRSEPGVDADSRTETFAALCLYLDNWRWADMPIYVRSGKRLARRLTEIHVVFRPVPRDLFSRDRGELRPGDTSPNIQPNALTLRIQPDEGFWLTVSSKVPGAGVQIRPVGMDFSYHSYFEADLPDAYERLLHDIARGDPTLFARGDEVEAAWAVVDSLFAAWAQQGDDRLHTYPAGSWGPKAAHNMLARARRMWRNSCDDEALVGQRCSLPRSH